MNIEMVISIGRDAIVTLILMGAPMLVAGALIGVLVSMIQTVTQLKDQSLAFIPKIVGVLLIMVLAAPFMIKTIVEYSIRVFDLALKLGHGF